MVSTAIGDGVGIPCAVASVILPIAIISSSYNQRIKWPVKLMTVKFKEKLPTSSMIYIVFSYAIPALSPLTPFSNCVVWQSLSCQNQLHCETEALANCKSIHGDDLQQESPDKNKLDKCNALCDENCPKVEYDCSKQFSTVIIDRAPVRVKNPIN
eukprot:NODE_70_length_24940_cov_0.663138.p17 type:complete len:155 gc:universal NODE_70_length_24940_cov_0.663138:11394-11858(+)